MQILLALDPSYGKKGWVNHPAVKMWKGYEEALSAYMNVAIILWKSKGKKNNMPFSPLAKHWDRVLPPWITPSFCSSHRSNLLRKDRVYYSRFNWVEEDDLPYIWPVK